MYELGLTCFYVVVEKREAEEKAAELARKKEELEEETRKQEEETRKQKEEIEEIKRKQAEDEEAKEKLVMWKDLAIIIITFFGAWLVKNWLCM